MEIKNLKGVYDYTPQEMQLRNRITDILRRNFERFGYAPLETAILNYRELLTYKYNDNAEIVREIYKLNDQGERDLGLRFDLTVPFCKYIALNRNLKMPFRRYEMGRVFRNGPVKSGRNREFWQCDADIVGDGSAEAEAEMIQLAVKCYTELGIVPQVQIGNRVLLTALIEYAGAKHNTDEIIGIIDKIKKVDKAETVVNLSKYMPKTSAENLVRYLGLGIDDLYKLLPGNEGIAQIRSLFGLLELLHISNSCIFTPSLARGLNIYTGTVWEVFEGSGRYASSLGGGGRYDSIITNFINSGQKYPAVGISFGLEPISAVLGADEKPANIANLLVVPYGTYKDTNEFVERIRDAGINTLLWTGAKVNKALEYADAAKIPFAAVIGGDEIKSGTVQIKDMQTGKQTAFPITETEKIAKFILRT
jgi:histidyl-tRNA synthetase